MPSSRRNGAVISSKYLVNRTFSARDKAGDFVRVVSAMRFHVAREGAMMGEFEEQIFRNKVFSGEIRPNDLYWIPGFANWRPVSEFRVARKTEPILLDSAAVVPPAIGKPNTRSAPAIALICLTALVLLFGIVMMTGRFRSPRVSQPARVEAKSAMAHGQIRVGMTADECLKLLGQPTRIEGQKDSTKEVWTYDNPSGATVLHFESGVLRSFK